ncbi:MAG: hypothetical protein NTV23_09795 [Propionibacteriales bacterium]|nr:hypothetical protein [Propionibacteriales bacterium]
MRSKLMTVLTVIGAVTVLVLAANTVALATTGKAILAGKINTSSTLTSIVRTTPGTGLQVKTKSTANAPFAVNGTGKVTNLNADKIDGKDSTVLGTRALVWSYAGSTASASTRTFSTTTMPAGSYLLNYEVYLTSGAGRVDCYLQRNSDGIYAAQGTADSNNGGTSLTGAGLITLTAPGVVRLVCSTQTAILWSVDQSQPLRITAVPITGLALKGSPAVS